jgi:hypothetical protein
MRDAWIGHEPPYCLQPDAPVLARYLFEKQRLIKRLRRQSAINMAAGQEISGP